FGFLKPPLPPRPFSPVRWLESRRAFSSNSYRDTSPQTGNRRTDCGSLARIFLAVALTLSVAWSRKVVLLSLLLCVLQQLIQRKVHCQAEKSFLENELNDDSVSPSSACRGQTNLKPGSVDQADSLEVAPAFALVLVPTPEAPALASAPASEPGPEEGATQEQHRRLFSALQEGRWELTHHSMETAFQREGTSPSGPRDSKRC